ncbi:MAG: SRPBCC family protein [Xanthomonadales bacterium]|nr:SRPBCC family protein [Xanthomonadales bacterium]
MKKVLLLALFLLAAFVVTGYLLPRQVHVERSVTIERPAGVVFAILNSYQYFDKWSPWAGRDPQAMFITSGPKSGVGARLSWNGDPQLVGSGWQEIVASKPYERIDIRLDFDAQGVADTGFLLAPEGDGTRVTWFFDSDLSEGVNQLDAFLARYFGLLFDRWVGGDFEQGLARLKRYAESLPAGSFNALEIKRVDVAAQNILYVSTSSSQEPADIAEAMAQAYARIGTFMFESGIERAAPPMAITRVWAEGGYEFDAAVPVAEIPAELPDDIQAGQSPSGAAVRAVHHGGYDQLMPTYEKLAAYLSAHGLSQGEVSWEHYISDPATTALADRVTHVYIMLQPPSGN